MIQKSIQGNKSDFHIELFYSSCLNESGECTITTSSMDGMFASFLKDNFYKEGETLRIINCEVVPGATTNSLVVSGKADFLNIPNLPVKAEFVFDVEGNVSVCIEYTFVKRGQTSNYWQFQKSFPFIPVREVYDTMFHGQEEKSLVDEFLFKEVTVVLSNTLVEDSPYGMGLTPGINFIAYTSMYGPLKILQTILDKDAETKVFGKINLPKLGTNFQSDSLAVKQKRMLNEQVFPWDFADDLPGVHLKAEIGKSIKIKDLELKNTYLKMYVPLGSWSGYDPIYTPVKGIVGELEIAKAGITIEANGIVSADNSLFVYTRFEGLSIGKLTELAGLCGGIALSGNLPSFVQKSMKKINQLEVLDLGFKLGLKDGKVKGVKQLAVSYATIQLGFRDLNWNIWDDHIVLNDLSLRFDLLNLVSNPYLKATLLAKTTLEGVPINIMGCKSGKEYILNASLGSAQTLPLKSFMKKCFPGLPAPGDLTIDSLAVEICPGVYTTVNGSLASKPNAWEIELGPKLLKVEDISFELTVAAKQKKKTATGTQVAQNQSRFSGFFSGTLSMDGIMLQLNYFMPDNFSIKANIDEIDLSKLHKSLTGQPLSSPGGFNLKLTNTQIIVEKEGSNFVFKALSTVPNVGMLAFQAGKMAAKQVSGSGKAATTKGAKASGEWGAAAGVYLTSPKISKIKGLEFIAPLEKMVSLKDITLIVSTIENADFQFPTTAAFSGNQTMNSTGITLPTASAGVVRGFNLNGNWVFKKTNKQQKVLQKVFNLDAVVPITIQVEIKKGKSPAVNLFASIDTTFNGSPLKIQMGLRFQSGTQPEYYVIGSGSITVAKKKLLLDVGVSVTVTGLSLAGSLQGTLDVQGLKISNLGLMGSINWGGVPGFGFTGRIDSRAFQSSITMLIDSANGGFVFAGSLSELNAYKVLTSIANVKQLPAGMAEPLKKIEIKGTKEFFMPKATVKALDSGDLGTVSQAFQKSGGLSIPANELDSLLIAHTGGKQWSLTNRRDNLKSYQLDLVNNKVRVVVAPQIYVCPTYSRIGAIEFQPGFFLSACLKIVDFEAYASIEINPSKGVAIEAYINKPIVISSKSFFCLSDVSKKRGPYISVSTFKQPKHAIKDFRQPHLYIDGYLRLMGLQLSCLAKISSKSLEIDAQLSLENKIRTDVIRGSVTFVFNIQAKVGNIDDFYAKFGVAFALKTSLYLANVKTASLNIAIAGTVEVGMKKMVPYAKLTAQFKLLGENCSVSVTLSPGKDGLNDAGKFLTKEIGKKFKKMYDDVGKFVEDVGEGILEGFEDSGKLAVALADDFGQAAEDVGKVLSDIGKGPEAIANALLGAKINPDDIAKALLKIDIKPLDIANALSNVKINTKDVERALKSIKIDTKAIENAVDDAFDDVGDAFKDLGKAIGGLFKKKKKKKKKRKPSADEIAQKLVPLTDNVEYLYKTMIKAGHSKVDIAKALKKWKANPQGLIQVLKKGTGNDTEFYRVLRQSGWRDISAVKEMKKTGVNSSRMAIALSLNDCNSVKIGQLLKAGRYPNKELKGAKQAAAENTFNMCILYTAHKRYLRAEDGGGKGLKGDAQSPKSHERFRLQLTKAKNKKDTGIRHGSKVAILTNNHTYVRANSKGSLDAKPTKVGSWEQFTVVNHTSKTRVIKKGDTISLKSAHNKYFVAEKKSKMYANRTKIGNWEKFVLK
ncbi:MAG: hypothetical protein OCD01_17260 [Fibrobacterales bacterium]